MAEILLQTFYIFLSDFTKMHDIVKCRSEEITGQLSRKIREHFCSDGCICLLAAIVVSIFKRDGQKRLR